MSGPNTVAFSEQAVRFQREYSMGVGDESPAKHSLTENSSARCVEQIRALAKVGGLDFSKAAILFNAIKNLRRRIEDPDAPYTPLFWRPFRPTPAWLDSALPKTEVIPAEEFVEQALHQEAFLDDKEVERWFRNAPDLAEASSSEDSEEGTSSSEEGSSSSEEGSSSSEEGSSSSEEGSSTESSPKESSSSTESSSEESSSEGDEATAEMHRAETSQQIDGTSCGLYSILNVVQRLQKKPFLESTVLSTDTVGGTPLKAFLRALYTRLLFEDQTKPADQPVEVQVKRKNGETYTLTVAFAAKAPATALPPMTAEEVKEGYKALWDNSLQREQNRKNKDEFKTNFNLQVDDVEKMQHDGFIGGTPLNRLLRRFVGARGLYIPSGVPGTKLKKYLEYYDKEKRWAKGNLFALVHANDNHWYVLEYNGKHVVAANSLEGNRDEQAEKRFEALVREYYGPAKARKRKRGKATVEHGEGLSYSNVLHVEALRSKAKALHDSLRDKAEDWNREAKSFEHNLEEIEKDFKDEEAVKAVKAFQESVLASIPALKGARVIEGMTYVRFKNVKNAVTDAHTDYDNLVNVRKVVSKAEAPRVRTVWVPLHQLTSKESALTFAEKKRNRGRAPSFERGTPSSLA